MKKFRLATAGNVTPPIYYLLLEKGFEIRWENGFYIAENERSEFVSEDLISLAGLIYLYENKGENWKESDLKIEEFVRKFENGN